MGLHVLARRLRRWLYNVKYLAYFPDFLTRDSVCRHRNSGMRVGGNLQRATPFMPSVTTLIGLLHD
jgi:hypothetical protein